MSSGKAIAYSITAIAGLRRMTNWLRKGRDTLKRSEQFKERCPSLRGLCLASIALDVEKQANQQPRGKAFFVRHNELVSMCNWSQSQRRSVQSSGAGS